MSNVIFDYGALEDAKANARKIVTGWGSIDDYQTELNNRLKSPLNEGRLAKDEPYGHSYVSQAQQEIAAKVTQLEEVGTQWIDLSTTIENFLQFVKDRDNEVVTIFETTSSQYTDYSGIGGFFNYIGDSFYNFYGVDLANSNGFTRAIADWGKERTDDLSYVIQQANDCFRHGNGRYVLNIIGSVAFTGAAIAGAILGIIGIPFSGGSTSVIVVSCVGAVASGVAALISAVNTSFTIIENSKAISIADDPGTARFHGDVEKFSDYVAKKDFGSKKTNKFLSNTAYTVDVVYAAAELTSSVTSIVTTFGTKTVVAGVDAKGKKIFKTSFERNPINIKNNVLKTFGFEVSSKKISADVVGINKTTVISNADEIGDTTIDIAKTTYKANYKGVALEKTIDIAEDGKKTVIKTAAFNKANVSTEYGSIVASNNVVTQEFSMYTAHAEAASTVIDYTKTAQFTPSRTLEAFQKASTIPALENRLKAVETGFKFVNMGTLYLKASDENRTEMVIQNMVKTNHLAYQFDKYLLKVDVSEDDNKFYLGGDAMKKFSTLWTTITGPAA